MMIMSLFSQSEHERLCAKKYRLKLARIYCQAGFENNVIRCPAVNAWLCDAKKKNIFFH